MATSRSFGVIFTNRKRYVWPVIRTINPGCGLQLSSSGSCISLKPPPFLLACRRGLFRGSIRSLTVPVICCGGAEVILFLDRSMSPAPISN